METNKNIIPNLLPTQGNHYRVGSDGLLYPYSYQVFPTNITLVAPFVLGCDLEQKVTIE